jgi:hypothetical protein
LDLIWSVGAIYNIGFERGIREWRPFLKTGGFIAVPEASWFTEERPSEIHAFWKEAYPEIDTISNKVAQMQKAGYIPTATFVLPENCWTEHFYAPQVAAQETFLKKYAAMESPKNSWKNKGMRRTVLSVQKVYGRFLYRAKNVGLSIRLLISPRVPVYFLLSSFADLCSLL